MVKKYLIIGGVGFIGSHLSEKLSKLGHSFAIIDNFSGGAPIKTPKIKENIYDINIENENEVARVFKKEMPDFVYHLAGVINLRRPIDDALFIKDLNFLTRTRIVLDACKANGVKKLVFVSSGAVYGNANVVPTPEDFLPTPNSLYALASLMVEKYIEFYGKRYALDYAIARLANVYGPGQWKSGIVPAMITQILKKNPPVIYGDGNQTRDFIYIDDVVGALILLSEKGNNQAYNVASGKETTLNETFKMIKNVTHSRILPIYKEANKEENKRSALDIKKIKKEIGWQPKVGLKEGLVKTIRPVA